MANVRLQRLITFCLLSVRDSWFLMKTMLFCIFYFLDEKVSLNNCGARFANDFFSNKKFTKIDDRQIMCYESMIFYFSFSSHV